MRAIDGASHGDEIGLGGRNVDGPFSGGQFEEDPSAPSAVIEHALDPCVDEPFPLEAQHPLASGGECPFPDDDSAVGVFGE